MLEFIATVLAMFTFHGPLVGESHVDPIDVSPPQTLSVLMHPTGVPVARCQDMGGTPVQVTFDYTLTFCMDVDY